MVQEGKVASEDSRVGGVDMVGVMGRGSSIGYSFFLSEIWQRRRGISTKEVLSGEGR